MKNFISYILLAVVSSTLFSCLDDDKAALDPSGSDNVIEFYDNSVPASPAGAIYPAWVTSFGVSPEDSFVQTVSYSGPNDNDQNITLTLAVDPVALQDYNEQQAEAQGANYKPFELLPADNYSIPSMTVTIPKGQTKADVEITVYPDKFDLSKNFAIPLRIVSSSHGTLSAHWSVAILATVVKNKYDGVYTVTPYGSLTAAQAMKDVTNPAFSGVYPKTIELRTVNGTTVNYYDQEYALQGHIFSTGTGLSYYGGFAAQFQFDDATNEVINVVNAFGQGNNNRNGKLDMDAARPIPVMTFEADGVTPKTLEIWYIMRQINTGVDRAFWKEVYTYEGPRD